MSGDQPGAGDGTGSLADEAAALFAAMGERAREHESHVGPDGPGGSGDCRWCPLCQAIGVVRSTSPEVRDQLVASAGTFLLALRELVEQVARGTADASQGPGATTSEHIGVSDESEDETWD